MSLLTARAISRVYGGKTGKAALDQASLAIAPGESVALLGRSGCGKSTLARLLAGLEQPDSGDVLFGDRPLASFRSADWKGFRRAVQMVFQDPLGAVNPRLTVGEIIAEPLRYLCGLKGVPAASRIAELLRAVDLSDDIASRLPQQLSGGQLQRVCIARALAPQPQLIILDEAVSNLDLRLQLQMLDLFAILQREHGVAYLFITHDLRLVSRFCSRVVVMDQGRMVEDVASDGLLALISAEGRTLQNAILPAMPVPRLGRPEAVRALSDQLETS